MVDFNSETFLHLNKSTLNLNERYRCLSSFSTLMLMIVKVTHVNHLGNL